MLAPTKRIAPTKIRCPRDPMTRHVLLGKNVFVHYVDSDSMTKKFYKDCSENAGHCMAYASI